MSHLEPQSHACAVPTLVPHSGGRESVRANVSRVSDGGEAHHLAPQLHAELCDGAHVQCLADGGEAHHLAPQLHAELCDGAHAQCLADGGEAHGLPPQLHV